MCEKKSNSLLRKSHYKPLFILFPFQKKAVGIYVPKKNSQKKSPSPNTNVSKVNNSRQPKRQKNPFKTKTRETQQQLTPPKRHKRKIPLKSEKKPPGRLQFFFQCEINITIIILLFFQVPKRNNRIIPCFPPIQILIHFWEN